MLIGACATALALASADGECRAAGPTKEECLDAHGRGQEQKDRGQLVRAKQTFLTCAQSTCPSLVQADCARFGEELAQLVPTVTFGARDARAGDLPLTTVYVDDVLVASRLDDGKAYELDPGKHLVRYVHEGRETTLRVVLGQGEKGRVLLATFVEPAAPKAEPIATTPPEEEPKRSKLPLVFAGAGGAALLAGGAMFAIGLAKVPGNCSTSSHECTVAPNDAALDDAHGAMSLANTGLAIGVAGAVTLAGGLLWYFMQPATVDRRGLAAPGVFTF
jgi:hypothetical protein